MFTSPNYTYVLPTILYTFIGELGKPVKIEKEHLLPEDRREYEKGWKQHSYNQYVSDKISLHRSLPTLRNGYVWSKERYTSM